MSLNTTADTKYIKLFSPVEFSENTYMVRNNLTEFPTNPKIGMDCMVKGMVYSYTQLDGYEFWMPSGVRRNYYIHNQDKFESDTWEIIHNLNSYDLTISIFDEDNVSISAQYKIIDEKSKREGIGYKSDHKSFEDLMIKNRSILHTPNV